MAIRKTRTPTTTKEKDAPSAAPAIEPVAAAPIAEVIPAPVAEVPIVEPVAEVPATPVYADFEAPMSGEKSDLVKVVAMGSDQFEPFQRIAFPQGVEVEVKLTSWVSAQVQAKVLRLV